MRYRTLSLQTVGARRRPMLAVAAAVTLAAVAMPLPVLAEDEDTSTQVYLVFDPETGEFIKSHDPNAALPPQTGLESTASAGAGASPAGSRNTTMFAAVVAALVIAGGAGLAILRSRRKPA